MKQGSKQRDMELGARELARNLGETRNQAASKEPYIPKHSTLSLTFSLKQI